MQVMNNLSRSSLNFLSNLFFDWIDGSNNTKLTQRHGAEVEELERAGLISQAYGKAGVVEVSITQEGKEYCALREGWLELYVAVVEGREIDFSPYADIPF